MTRVIGPKQSKRRRWTFLIALLCAVGLGITFIPGAFAVHDEAFQLDGNTAVDAATNLGGNTQNKDWDSFFNASGAKIAGAFSGDFTAGKFVADFKTTTDRKGNVVFDTSDDSTYTIGSKDIDNVSSWSCTPANNTTDKGDIMNAYAVAYTDPVTKDQILYFALERNANTGDANVAFWFLQGSASCTGSTNFTGDHQDGDLLIVSAFTKGGNVSTVDAYKWQGGANGSLNTVPVAHGVDCRDSVHTTLNDPECAAANTSAITTQWTTENKTDGVGHTLQSGEFFEGGINLTDSGLAGKCFNTFIADTRSSQSLTATLYDFAVGSLGECTSSITTTPKNGDGTAGPATSIGTSASVQVTDSANLTVTGVQSWQGSLKFFLCADVASGANCSTGGTQIGNTITVSKGISGVTDTTIPVLSSAATVTKATKYCWRAEFHATTPSNGIPDATDPGDATSQSECFTLAPVTPQLATQSTNSTSGTAQSFGGTIDDKATLSGTANKPGSPIINPTTAGGVATGTITFKAYGPFSFDHVAVPASDCVDSGTGANLVYTSHVTVSGDKTNFASSFYQASSGDGGAFTPSAPGKYYWVASYGGDSPNTNAASDTACGASTEQSFVQQIPTQINTAPSVYPNDSSTVSSTVAGDKIKAGATVVYRLFQATGGATPKTALQNCNADDGTGTALGLLYSETSTALATDSNSYSTHTNNGSLSSGNVAVSPTSAATYYWRVTLVLASGDTAHLPIQSKCVENTVVTVTNDSGPGTTP